MLTEPVTAKNYGINVVDQAHPRLVKAIDDKFLTLVAACTQLKGFYAVAKRKIQDQHLTSHLE